MGSYAAENLPLLFCYPVPSLDTDSQLIRFGEHGIGLGAEQRKKTQQKTQNNNNKNMQTFLKKIRWDLRKVKPEFLAARLFHKQAKAEAIICEGRRELLAPVRFDFSGRNWISSH